MGMTAVVVFFPGCVKDRETEFSGKQIVFAASTGTLETRTEYGVDNASGSVSYVDWVDGDGITILMSPGSSANYTITNVHDGNDTDGISKASIAPSGGGTGLAWGESGSYDFYAMYPASGTNGSSLDASSMTAVIPATWYATDANVDKLPYGYMLATATGISAQADAVPLVFNPKYTSFCFTLKNPTSSDVTLASVSLSSATKALSGTYSVDTSDGTVTLDSGNSNKTITAYFTGLANGGLKIPMNNGTNTFTIVTVPDSFNDLTVTITTTGGTEKTLPLKKTGGSNPGFISFAALKKHNINITLPDYSYSFSVTDAVLNTSDGFSTRPTVTSTGPSSNVGWSVVGYYPTKADALAGTNSITTGQLATITGVSDPTAPMTTISAPSSVASKTLMALIDDSIKNSTFGALSSSERYINLANPANLTSSSESNDIVESANCYIVNGPGYYRIPLVLGNSITNNAVYTSSFAKSTFYNHAKAQVTSSNVILSFSNPDDASAELVWEDRAGLIENSFSIASSTLSIGGNNTTVYWLKFHVNSVGQGNAVIQVKDGTTVLWSYHIWVTNFVPKNYYDEGVDITNAVYEASYTEGTGTSAGSYYIQPYDLGWVVNNITASCYDVGEIYVSLQQITSGNRAIMKISRSSASSINATDLQTGYPAYYQHGRKDPLLGAYYSTTTGIIHGMDEVTSSSGLDNHVQTGISNPGKFVASYLNTNATQYWNTSLSANSWNEKKAHLSIGKSIYDPCPAGYHVPPYGSQTNLSLPNTGQRNATAVTNVGSAKYHWSAYWYYNSEYGSVAFPTNSTSGLIRHTGLAIRPVRRP